MTCGRSRPGSAISTIPGSCARRGLEGRQFGGGVVDRVTVLEIGYSARDASELDAGLHGPPVGSTPIEYATPIAVRIVPFFTC